MILERVVKVVAMVITSSIPEQVITDLLVCTKQQNATLPEKKFWQWALAHASMASRLKSCYFGPYLAVALQNKVFKCLRAG